MAVVPMQKVRLLVHRNDVDAALTVIQRNGALQFTPVEKDESFTDGKVEFPQASLLPRVQHAVSFLAPYAPKVGVWKALTEGTRTELTESEVQKKNAQADIVCGIVEDLEKIQVEFADKNETVRRLEERVETLKVWKTLPVKVSHLETRLTVTKLVKRNNPRKEDVLADLLQTLFDEQELPVLVTPVSTTLVAVTLMNEKEALHTFNEVVATVGADVLPGLEGEETPEVELTKAEEQLAKAKGEIALLHDQAEHFAITHYKTLCIASEIFSWERDRYSVRNESAATKFTAVFEGWLNADRRESIEATFTEKNISAAFSEVELTEDEQPPVEIQNSPLVQPFEAVTRLYGMPGYKDLDPTVFLAGFFFLFFGLCLTDVGYGFALVIGSLFILLFAKVSDGTKLFAKLLLFIGTSTVLIGALFGGYLGVSPEALPAPLQAIQQFDPIGNPLPVFYLALSLGVFQVMVGLLLKIYSDARNGALLDGILDQGPWLLMFCIGILYVLTAVGYVDLISTDQIGNLALVGVVLIVLASGRSGEGILGKIISAFLGLYAGVGFLSDILSYSRLLALGLATSALAFAVNLIASMVIGVPYVGFLLAAIIFLIGHSFTLVINTLGAFIHSARLQFVEFFSKFIVGTGKEFTPLTRSEEYITVGDD